MELYMKDCYIKEFDAFVTWSEPNCVVLSQTAFQPRGGGLPSDTGFLIWRGEKVPVKEVLKEKGVVKHVIEGYIPKDSSVHGVLDWERRYRIMRMHTAAHVLSAVFYRETGALITGNQIGIERSRIDFSLKSFDRELMSELVEEANKIVKEGRKVRIYFLPREEAMKIEGVVKLAKKLPPSIKELRIVEIEGVDVQADGGVHVSNTKEIGKIEALKFENKGKEMRRVYFRVVP